MPIQPKTSNILPKFCQNLATTLRVHSAMPARTTRRSTRDARCTYRDNVQGLFAFLFVGGFGVKKMLTILADILGSGGAKVCKSCRSRQELSNEYLLAKIGVDTAENEPLQVCPLSAYRSPRSTLALLVHGGIQNTTTRRRSADTQG